MAASHPLDWQHCVICQTESDDRVTSCPANSKDRNGVAHIYGQFVKNVHEFKLLGLLPIDCPLESFGDATEESIVQALVSNRAVWHKNCHDKFSNSKLYRAKMKLKDDGTSVEARKKQPNRHPVDIDNCIFCDKSGKLRLHKFATLPADSHVRKMATALNDVALLSKIAGGDVVAIDGKYHVECLTGLRNRYRSYKRKQCATILCDEQFQLAMSESRAFTELLGYIDSRIDEGCLLFPLTELHSLFTARLQDLGICKEINKSRLKTKILEHFLDAEQQTDGKNVVIVFKEAMRKLVKEALMDRDCDAENLLFSKVVTGLIFLRHL
jgi:hypothetical protein